MARPKLSSEDQGWLAELNGTGVPRGKFAHPAVAEKLAEITGLGSDDPKIRNAGIGITISMLYFDFAIHRPNRDFFRSSDQDINVSRKETIRTLEAIVKHATELKELLEKPNMMSLIFPGGGGAYSNACGTIGVLAYNADSARAHADIRVGKRVVLEGRRKVVSAVIDLVRPLGIPPHTSSSSKIASLLEVVYEVLNLEIVDVSNDVRAVLGRKKIK
jgi:hypothetical protein